MEKLSFVFRKSRGIGDLIQDYLTLFRRIFRHFNRTVFQFLLPFLALFILIVFFSSSLGVDFFNNAALKDATVITVIAGLAILVSLIFFLFIPTFGIEYMFLLEERDACDFTAKAVWQRLRAHLGKYFVFFWAALLVMLVLLIPLILIYLVLAFIPFIGAIAMGIAGACLTAFYYCALFLYITGRERLFGSFPAAFRLIKQKLFVYGIAAYIFQWLSQVVLGLLTLIPIIIMVVIAYNTIGFNEKIFVSFGGKMLLSLASTLFMAFITISAVYLVSFYTLIFFSSLEDTYQEGTIGIIDQIGDTQNEL